MTYCYTIPYRDKFIIYRPLAGLAFLANAALVNFIEDCLNRPGRGPVPDNETTRFLQDLGFFEPDPPPPVSVSDASVFEPVTAVLFLTTQCNFRCTYCYASGGEQEPVRGSLELGRRAIDLVRENAARKGDDHFVLGFHGGGEPSLEKDLLRALIPYARRGNPPCRISLTSNGYWDDEWREWLFNNIDEFSLSFDGDRPTQDRQRPLASGRGSFDGVMKTIRGLDQRGLSYGIRLTVTDESAPLLPENIHFLIKETGCPVFQAEPAFDHGRARNNGSALKNSEAFVRFFMEAHDLASEAGRTIYYSGARPWVLTDRFCQAPDKALIVGPQGFLTACYEIFGPSHFLADRFFFGRLSEENGLEVDAGRRQALDLALRERRAECEGCFCYWHCAGDCPSKAFSGCDLERCFVNRSITRELIIRRMIEGDGLWIEPRFDCLGADCGRLE